MDNVSSTVSIQGDVNKPGAYPIVKPDQRVLDAIAMALGAQNPPYETGVSVTRGRARMQVRRAGDATIPDSGPERRRQAVRVFAVQLRYNRA